MPFRRRPRPASAVPGPTAGSLLALAFAYGADAATASRHVEHATAEAAEPAAQRRRLLSRLRQDRSLTTPPVGRIDRLAPPARGADEPAHVLERLNDAERTVLVGALLDGLDATALAHATGTTRTGIKGTARSLLAKLDGTTEGEQTLATVASLMAGEYALGLLHPDGQRLFERGLALDADLQTEVDRWDGRLAELTRSARVAVATPPPPAAAVERHRLRPALIAAAFIALIVGAVAWPSSPGTPYVPTPRTTAAVVPERTAPAPGRAAELRAVPARAALPAATVLAASSSDLRVPMHADYLRTPTATRARFVTAREQPAHTEGASIIVHAHDPAAADALLDRIRAAGVAVRDVVTIDLAITRDRVRYFFPEDRAVAEAVSAGLPMATDVQDFTHYVPRPTPGTLELWLRAEAR